MSGKTRVFPVVTKVIVVNVYELAKNIVDARYNDKIALVAEYSSYDGSIPASSWSSFQSACNELMDKYDTYVGVSWTPSFNKYARWYPDDTPPQWIVYDFTQQDIDRASKENVINQSKKYSDFF